MRNLSVRLPDDVHAELKDLAARMNMSMNSALILCIRTQYHDVVGDPKITDALEKLNKLTALLKEFEVKA